MINKLGRLYRRHGTKWKTYWRLFRDPRTPLMTKLLFGAAFGYVVSPIDILPDISIPFVGHLDDIIVVPFLIWIGMQWVPASLLSELDKESGASQKV